MSVSFPSLFTLILMVFVTLGGGIYFYCWDVTNKVTNVSNDVQEGQLLRSDSPVLGPVSAPVTLVEFFDPSSKECRALLTMFMKEISKKYPREARLVLRYNPTNGSSEEVLRIIEAARQQNKLEPILMGLLKSQSEWGYSDDHGTARTWDIAGDIGLELRQAKRAASSDAVDKIIARDLADRKAIGVTSDHMFFVNGKTLPSFNAQRLEDIVREEIEAIASALPK